MRLARTSGVEVEGVGVRTPPGSRWKRMEFSPHSVWSPSETSFCARKKMKVYLRKDKYFRNASPRLPQMVVMGLPTASSNLNGSLHLGPRRSSPRQCFLPGRISLYKCHRGNCFPESFIADLTRKAWHVLFQGGMLVIGNDCGTACRGESPKPGKKRLHLANTWGLDNLQGRWWFFKFLFTVLQAADE